MKSSKRKRIEVQLPERTSFRQRRELGAFVTYCVLRIEKELGERERWDVRIEVGARGDFTTRVTTHHLEVAVVATGFGRDAELATWDAMCRLEQLIRDRRGSIHRTHLLGLVSVG